MTAAGREGFWMAVNGRLSEETTERYGLLHKALTSKFKIEKRDTNSGRPVVHREVLPCLPPAIPLTTMEHICFEVFHVAKFQLAVTHHLGHEDDFEEVGMGTLLTTPPGTEEEQPHRLSTSKTIAMVVPLQQSTLTIHPGSHQVPPGSEEDSETSQVMTGEPVCVRCRIGDFLLLDARLVIEVPGNLDSETHDFFYVLGINWPGETVAPADIGPAGSTTVIQHVNPSVDLESLGIVLPRA